jgi:hypothetical protein
MKKEQVPRRDVIVLMVLWVSKIYYLGENIPPLGTVLNQPDAVLILRLAYFPTVPLKWPPVQAFVFEPSWSYRIAVCFQLHQFMAFTKITDSVRPANIGHLWFHSASHTWPSWAGGHVTCSCVHNYYRFNYLHVYFSFVYSFKEIYFGFELGHLGQQRV